MSFLAGLFLGLFLGGGGVLVLALWLAQAKKPLPRARVEYGERPSAAARKLMKVDPITGERYAEVDRIYWIEDGQGRQNAVRNGAEIGLVRKLGNGRWKYDGCVTSPVEFASATAARLRFERKVSELVSADPDVDLTAGALDEVDSEGAVH